MMRMAIDDAKPKSRRKLTADKRRTVCAILSSGGNRVLAARFVGCSVRTIYYTALADPAFRDELRKAQANAELASLQIVTNAAGDAKYWKAATWLLERR